MILEVLLIAFSVEVSPARDTEAVHDACVDEIKTAGRVRPRYIGNIVDLKLCRDLLID